LDYLSGQIHGLLSSIDACQCCLDDVSLVCSSQRRRKKWMEEEKQLTHTMDDAAKKSPTLSNFPRFQILAVSTSTADHKKGGKAETVPYN
jgi:hypothetical protein